MKAKTIQGRWGDSTPENFPRLWTLVRWPAPIITCKWIGGTKYKVGYSPGIVPDREYVRTQDCFYFMGEKQ